MTSRAIFATSRDEKYMQRFSRITRREHTSWRSKHRWEGNIKSEIWKEVIECHISFRTGINSGLLWIRYWIFDFHRRWKIYWQDEWLSVPYERHWCSNINYDSVTHMYGLALFAFILLLNIDYTDTIDAKSCESCHSHYYFSLCIFIYL